ncbi:NifB/NifX family molybdenum-iron cluster-binding protein [Methanococcus sp. CF]
MKVAVPMDMDTISDVDFAKYFLIFKIEEKEVVDTKTLLNLEEMLKEKPNAIIVNKREKFNGKMESFFCEQNDVDVCILEFIEEKLEKIE